MLAAGVRLVLLRQEMLDSPVNEPGLIVQVPPIPLEQVELKEVGQAGPVAARVERSSPFIADQRFAHPVVLAVEQGLSHQ